MKPNTISTSRFQAFDIIPGQFQAVIYNEDFEAFYKTLCMCNDEKITFSKISEAFSSEFIEIY